MNNLVGHQQFFLDSNETAKFLQSIFFSDCLVFNCLLLKLLFVMTMPQTMHCFSQSNRKNAISEAIITEITE